MRKLVLGLLLACALAAPAQAQSGNPPPLTQFSVPITIVTATTTRLVIGVTGQQIYVTSALVLANGTGNIQFISGTGATCGTGSANVTGNISLTAQVGFVQGVGAGAIWVIPSGASLCAVTSAAIGYPGVLAYAQF